MEKEKDRLAETLFYDLLKLENEAFARLQATEEALMVRYNVASDPESDDSTVEEFSRWLHSGREDIKQARAGLSAITLERDLVRQALITSHSSAGNR